MASPIGIGLGSKLFRRVRLSTITSKINDKPIKAQRLSTFDWATPIANCPTNIRWKRRDSHLASQKPTTNTAQALSKVPSVTPRTMLVFLPSRST